MTCSFLTKFRTLLNAGLCNLHLAANLIPRKYALSQSQSCYPLKANWPSLFFFRGRGPDPVPDPYLVSRPLIAVFKFFFNITFFTLIEAALLPRNLSSHLFI
jgi:hypothetical protein